MILINKPSNETSAFFLLYSVFLQGCGELLPYALGAHEQSHKASHKIGNRIINDRNIIRYVNNFGFVPIVPIREENKSNIDFGNINLAIHCDTYLNSHVFLFTCDGEKTVNKFLNVTNGKNVFLESIVSASKTEGIIGRCKIYFRWSGYAGAIHDAKMIDGCGEFIMFKGSLKREYFRRENESQGADSVMKSMHRY